VRHLLTHTAGVPPFGDGSAPLWTGAGPSEAALLAALDVELEAAPGERHTYSTAGMALAGVVVARASGVELRRYLRDHVLTPLGMHDAAWHRDHVPAGALAVGRSPALVVDAPHGELGAFEAAGGLYASLADMIAFAALPRGRAGVLAPATLAAAIADDPLPGPHGAAWEVTTAGAHTLLTHTGATSDYTATIAAVPTADRAVVVLLGGDAVELSECVAAQLGRHVLLGEAPGSCVAMAPWPIADDGYLDAARSVRDLFAAPSEDAVHRTFAPAFVEGFTVEQLLAVAGAAGRDLGACGEPVLEGRHDGGAIVRLPCARKAQRLWLALEALPPHRVIVLRPVN
jgi:CubicO group peptidase (beta-lactamase class C family)